jgi:1-pyrroline-5-carboxylate dehydrogenase
MIHGMIQTPPPRNEEAKTYAPGTADRSALQSKLRELSMMEVEIPLIIGGERVETGRRSECRVPHDHRHPLGNFHQADEKAVHQAVAAAAGAWPSWSQLPWESRAAVFLKAADLLTGCARQLINASTMLGISKTAHQSEIDAVCEMADFFRFNVHFMSQIYQLQPLSPPGQWNMMEWRPLEGFVLAVSPFNFTSIAANLPAAPALMGNTVVWKPASSAVFPAYYVMLLLEEAGLPPGVINMVPGPGSVVGAAALTHPDLAGVHFTGSTATFREMWQVISKNIEPARFWPRIVGETGGKDFIFAHPSAHVPALTTAIIRGAFEYQGQKCSAASRCYIPESIWPKVKEQLLDELSTVTAGDVSDFKSFMGAVIDRAAFERIGGYIDHARTSPDAAIIAGGERDDSVGYFVQPTVIQATDPRYRSMVEEIFGPVLTVHVYPDARYSETLALCNETSPYGLTGAIFAKERRAIVEASEALRNAAGNFYVNDKPTGAVVGQQPFGGSRASGTNDKAGSLLNLLRWVSPRTIKETFDPPTNYRYPFMGA